MEYRQVRVIGGKGSGPDQFTGALNGLGIDKDGLLYAAGDRAIKVFDSTGALKNHWKTEGPAYCVSIHDDMTVFVGSAGQVEMFDQVGKSKGTWKDAQLLGAVTSIGFFGKYVLVADASDRCIRRFDRNGKWINNIGKDNNTRGFLIPNGYLDFSVDAEGIIHASNSAKFRIERYTMTGEFVGKFGKFGMKNPEDFRGCCNPTNLTLTGDGLLIVTEKAGPRLKIYDADRKLTAYVGADAFDANCKNMDVAVDTKGLIYVGDTVRLHILVFAPVESADASATTNETQPTQGVTKP